MAVKVFVEMRRNYDYRRRR